MPYWLIIALGISINGYCILATLKLMYVTLRALSRGGTVWIYPHYIVSWFAMIFYWSYVLYH